MLDYPTTRALEFNTLSSLISDLYKYDVKQYSQLKKSEGQYAYFDYIGSVQRAIKNVFYKPLLGRSNSIASTLNLSSLPRSSDTCIVLNNHSLLGHVTVLRSIGYLLQNNSRKGKIKIISASKGSDKNSTNWKNHLSKAGLHVVDLSRSSLADRFIEADLLINPRQYIWWGWPPGQWIGPLLSRNAIHRSVSFKYDFPAALGFHSHHIGYGKQYVRNIFDECPLFGFSQYFSADLIPSFSNEKKQESIWIRLNNHMTISSKRIINLGTLGRSEKIAQQPFLDMVKDIMLNDNRVIFHWTGKEKSNTITDFFGRYGLLNRTIFHGWVKPWDYLKQLDVYLDTFPFGTGETFVLAGLMGIPLVTMSSPYEANFTNLMHTSTSNQSLNLVSTNTEEYRLKVLKLLGGLEKYCPQEISKSFEEFFTTQSLTCSKQTAIFSRQLDL